MDVFRVNVLDILKTCLGDVFGTGVCPLGLKTIVSSELRTPRPVIFSILTLLLYKMMSLVMIVSR